MVATGNTGRRLAPSRFRQQPEHNETATRSEADEAVSKWRSVKCAPRRHRTASRVLCLRSTLYPMCGRHPVGKGFWRCHEELVGSAHVSGLFARREHRWPSCYPQDQLPIKSTRSRRSGINGFCRSPVVDRLSHDLTCRPFQLHEARPDGPAYCYAACVTGSRYSPPRVISTQAIRAILLAMATAAILLLRRCNSLSNQGRFVP
jgi:hypothetical protein